LEETDTRLCRATCAEFSKYATPTWSSAKKIKIISIRLIRDNAFVEFLNAVTNTETIVDCKLKRSVILKPL